MAQHLRHWRNFALASLLQPLGFLVEDPKPKAPKADKPQAAMSEDRPKAGPSGEQKGKSTCLVLR